MRLVVTQHRLKKEHLWPSESVVTTTMVKVEFLVTATDGLWECLQNKVVDWRLDGSASEQDSRNGGGGLGRNALLVTLPEHGTAV